MVWEELMILYGSAADADRITPLTTTPTTNKKLEKQFKQFMGTLCGDSSSRSKRQSH